MIRGGDRQSFEEGIGHPGVVVLARVDDAMFDAGAGEGRHHGCQLRELWSRPHDAGHPHAGSVSVVAPEGRDRRSSALQKWVGSVAIVDPTAEISPDAVVDPSASIWHHTRIREHAHVGNGAIIGAGVCIGPGVLIGDHCKIQNHAQVYEPAVVADGVFIGPGVVFTNDRHPRAVNPDGSQKSAADWEPVGVTVLSGASIGARAVCVAPVTIGRWALVAAGSVVVKDVPDFALVAGVPARRIGWVGPAGEALVEVEGDPDQFECPRTGARFVLVDPDTLTEAAHE